METWKQELSRGRGGVGLPGLLLFLARPAFSSVTNPPKRSGVASYQVSLPHWKTLSLRPDGMEIWSISIFHYIDCSFFPKRSPLVFPCAQSASPARKLTRGGRGCEGCGLGGQRQTPTVLSFLSFTPGVSLRPHRPAFGTPVPQQ